MAKNTGLGRGLDSLIPKIEVEEKEVDSNISLEDLLKKSEEDSLNSKKLEIEEKIEEEKKEEDNSETKEKIIKEEVKEEEKGKNIDVEEKIEDIKENIKESKESKESDETKKNKEEETKKLIKSEVSEEKEKESEDSSNYTNIFNNDDEIVENKKIIESEEKNNKIIEEKIISEKTTISETENDDKINESSINLNEENNESIKNIEATNENIEVESLLTEKEEELVDEVVETVEKNPRITLWSARSAAVLRYLRKTEPEFSISNEASSLIDDAIAEKYPEIWTLFNHL